MKLAINKMLRRVLFFLSAVSFITASCFAGTAIIKPGTVEEKEPIYSYSQDARVKYRVYLLPNSLYPENSLEEGKLYLTNFVDYINTFFTYEFKGQRPAEIKGDYNVVASVEATGLQGKQIWIREFVLLPNTGFGGKDREISIQREIPIKLQDYVSFVKRVIKDSEFVPEDIAMTVRWNVNLQAQTDSGPVKEQISPTLVIPLGQNYLEISGEPKKEKAGSISRTIQVPAKVNKRILTVCSIAAGVCAAVLVWLLFFTTAAAPVTDPLLKKVNEIIKKHGDRLVAIDGDVPLHFEKTIAVKSIEDLVRIADELSKPVMYRSVSGSIDKASFYVFNEPEAYIFELIVSGRSLAPTSSNETENLKTSS